MSVSMLQLLSPQLISAKLTLRKASRSLAFPLVLILGALCLWGCYYAGSFVFGKLHMGNVHLINNVTELLMQKTMGFVFTFFSYILLFSTLISSLNNHYLASDLPLLISAPISVSKIFYSRTIGAWAQSSWMVFIFAWPTLAACGAQLNAPWSFYVVLTFCLFCLTLWCAGVASILALVLARIFPARRLQEALVIFVVAAFIYIYYKFNAARPDRFFSEEGFNDLRDLLNSLREVGSESGLVGWSVRAIFATIPTRDNVLVELATRSGDLITPLALLTTLVTSIFAGAGWLAHYLYVPGYWLCQEGIGRAGESKPRRATPRYASSQLSALVRREWQIFWRSPSQWTQLLLVGSLSIVYIYNFKYFDTLHSTGFFNTATLYTTHISLTGMVMITLAARFLYPSVSVEGKAIWVLQSAPIRAREVLLSKVLWARWSLLALSTTLSLLGAWFTNLSLVWIIVTLWSGWLLTFIVLGLSVGMGAFSPRFNLANPQMVSAGLGGISFMLLALLCVGILSTLSFSSANALMLIEYRAESGGGWMFGITSAYQAYGVWPLVGWIGANLFAFSVYYGTLALGARRLESILNQDIQTEG